MWYTIRKCISRKEVSQPVFTKDMEVEIANGLPSQTPPATTAFVPEKEIQVPFPPVSFLGLTKFR